MPDYQVAVNLMLLRLGNSDRCAQVSPLSWAPEPVPQARIRPDLRNTCSRRLYHHFAKFRGLRPPLPLLPNRIPQL